MAKQTQKKFQPVLAGLLNSRSFLMVCIFVPVVIIALDMLGIFRWKCPTYTVTGLYCPGCGMTRAGMSIIQGDFASAFSHHPFSLLFAMGWIFFLVLLFIPDAQRKDISAKFAKIEEKFPIILMLFIVFLFFGLARVIFQIYD